MTVQIAQCAQLYSFSQKYQHTMSFKSRQRAKHGLLFGDGKLLVFHTRSQQAIHHNPSRSPRCINGRS
ncbi:hypothetical protein CLU79DRAFT_728637 [Phycomyces nitens]|nr:hypothetical protein CLU79DRAFT_728637 [Phycomyces nitens]